MEERKHQRNNRIDPPPDIARQQRISVIEIGVIRRTTYSDEDNDETNNSEREDHETANMPWNNAIYNKNLIEVGHIAILSVVVVICLAKANIMTSMHSKETIEHHSRLLLFMLDVSPVVLISIFLPFMIIARQTEMQNWIQSFFRRQ